MEALWRNGTCSVREILETFPEPDLPAYTTVQTTVYRLERKKALRCVKRISNANIFEATISREDAHSRVVSDLLTLLAEGQAVDGALGGIWRTHPRRREGGGEGAAQVGERRGKRNGDDSPIAINSVHRDRVAADTRAAESLRGHAVSDLAGGVD